MNREATIPVNEVVEELAPNRRFRPYSDYRDSGVEWLGRVPAHWKVARASTHLSPEGFQVSAEALNGRDVLHYSIPAVQEFGDGIVEPGEHIDSGKIQLCHAALLVSKLNPRKSTIIFAQPRHEPTVCSGEFVVLRPSTCHGRYAEYVYRSEEVRQRLDSLVQSVTRSHQRVNPSDIRKLDWTWPSLGEQQAIAAFLDRETARIDELIAKKQRLIKLLAEKRTALISQAVTKGLNPDAPMKDSGVEWLDQIPACWQLMRLKRLTMRIGDGLHGTPEYEDDSPYRFVNGNNLSHGSIVFTPSTRCVSAEEFQKHHVDLGNNTLLLSINGTIGNLAYYRGESIILGKSAAYINCKEPLERSFLFYFLQCTAIQRFFESVATLLGIPALRLLNAALGSEKTVATVSSTFDRASPRKEEDRNIPENMLALNSTLG